MGTSLMYRIRSHLLPSLLVLVCPSLLFGAQNDPQVFTPELALKVKHIRNLQVSPDGKMVAFEVVEAVIEEETSEWVSHLYVARSDGSGSFPLTPVDRSAISPIWSPVRFRLPSPRWSPDGRWIAFVSSRSGTPNIWRISIAGGEPEQITNVKGGVEDLQWSPDGSQIASVMHDPKTEEEIRAEQEKRDVWVADTENKLSRLYLVPVEKDANGQRPVRKLTTENLDVYKHLRRGSIFRLFDWSPDGASIVFSHATKGMRQDISILDLASGKRRLLVSTRARELQPVFSPDGRWIAYAASEDPPRLGGSYRIYVIDAAGGERRPLAETYDSYPVIIGWSADGTRVLYGESYRTVFRLSALPVDGGPPIDLSPPDLMVEAARINSSRTHVGFISESPTRPPEVFISRLDHFAPTQVSHVQDLPQVAIGKTEVVSWQARDGMTIEGLLTYPVGYRPGSQVPLLVLLHGGGRMAHWVQEFTGLYRTYVAGNLTTLWHHPVPVFAARGYAVLRPNIRGGRGYGRERRAASYGDSGGGDYSDIMSGIDALIERGIADPERLGIMGWSWGAYLAAWAITQTDRFKAASLGGSITDRASLVEDCPNTFTRSRGIGCYEYLEHLRSRSPMFHAKGVTTPALFLNGERDTVHPVWQARQFYNVLKWQGVPTKLVIYPRQPRMIVEPKLLLHAIKENLEWFDRWILRREASTR